jgi:hypothetical protein
MTVQLPGDLKDGKLGGDPKPAEDLPSVAADARVLIERAAISEDEIKQDWKPKPAPEPVTPPAEGAVPFADIVPHHLKAAYERLKVGSSVQDAARVAGVPVEVAQAIADEIVAVCATLGAEAPVNCKPAPVVEPGPVEPLEEPVG